MSAQISKVENERDLLQRELNAVEDDIAGRQQDEHLVEDNLTMAERFRDLTESVRQKNQHITQLLSDIEVGTYIIFSNCIKLSCLSVFG